MMTTKKRLRAIGTLGVIAAAGPMLTGCGPPGAKEARQGEQLVQAGQFADALGPLKEAAQILTAAPGPQQSKVWNLLGLAYHGAKQFDSASEAYGRALKLDRNNVAADYNLGCLRMDQGNLPGAIDYLTTYVALRARDVNGYLRLGAAHYHLALERGGMQHNVLMEAARHDYEMAERVGVSAQGPNALGVIELQRRYPNADSIKTAARDFQLALDRDPHFWPALLNLAIVEQQYLNQPRQALENYRKYLAIDPALPRAKEVEKTARQLDLQLRITITPEPREHQAAPPAQNVLPPTNPPPSRPKPVTVEPPPVKPPVLATGPPPPEQSQVSLPAPTPAPPPTPPPKAAEPLPAPAPPARAPVVSPAPQSAPVNTSNSNKAPVEVAVAAPPSAPPRKSFAQAINPLHWFSGKSKTVEAPGAEPPLPPKGARYKYPLPVILIPGDRPQARRWTEEGAQARQDGRLSEAVRDYQQAVQADPTYFEANQALGLAALDAGDSRTALEALHRALTLRSDSADARYAFAWVLQKRGYYEDAAKELDKLLAAHPEEVRGHLLLGKLYAEKLNKAKLARQHYAKALELDPQNAEAGAIRAWMGESR
jgi:tetratricopeptide (TPR) repeat protein